MNNQKKLIQAFKTFVDKTFMPQIRKTDQAYLQWNKFSIMLANDNINYDDLLNYTEKNTQSSGVKSFEKMDNLAIIKKKQRDVNEIKNQESTGAFNPSRTFGPQYKRMFPLKADIDDFGGEKSSVGSYGNFGVSNREDQKKKNMVSPQTILPGLERLCKNFVENQQRIENLLSVSTGSNGVGSSGKYY